MQNRMPHWPDLPVILNVDSIQCEVNGNEKKKHDQAQRGGTND